MVLRDRRLLRRVAAVVDDADWLVAQRALDLLEKTRRSARSFRYARQNDAALSGHRPPGHDGRRRLLGSVYVAAARRAC